MMPRKYTLHYTLDRQYIQFDTLYEIIHKQWLSFTSVFPNYLK